MANNNLPQNKNSNKTFLQKLYKTFFVLLIGFASFFLMASMLLPTIASTHWGQQQIEHYLSEKFKKPLKFEEMRFSFLGSQEIKGLKIEDNQENFLLEISSATIDQSFPHLIFGGMQGSTVIFSDLNLSVKDVSLRNVSGEIRLSPLILRLKGLSAQNNVEGQFNLDIALNGVDFDEISELLVDPELFLSSGADLKASLKAENFPVLFLDSLLTTFLPNSTPGLFTTLFGDRLNLSLKELKTSEKEHLTLELSAISPNFSANLMTKFASDKIFTTKPSTLSLKIDQDFLTRFLKKEFGFELEAPTTVVAHLDAFSLPFNLKTAEHDFSKLMLKGNIDFQEVLLKSKTDLPDIFLQKFNTSFEAEADSEYFEISLEADALQEKEPIKVLAKSVLHKSLDLKKHKMPPTSLTLNHIPVALVDHFLSLDQKLLKAIGSYIDLKAEATPKRNGVDLLLQFESEKLSLLPFKLKIDDDLTLLEPLKLEYRLNKEAAEKLLPENAFLNINSDKPIRVTVDFAPIQNIYELREELPKKFKGRLLIEQLSFGVKNSYKELFFENIYLPWQLDTENKKLHVDFSGITRPGHKPQTSQFLGKADLQKQNQNYLFDISLERQKHTGEKSNLAFTGSSENVFTDDGGLNLYGLSLNIDAKITNLQTPLFCKMMCLHKDLHKKIEVLFGKILNGHLHASIKELDGVVEANISGLDGSLTLDSFIQEGTLFLNKPFEAKFKVSPRLGTSILKDLVPFLSGVVESDQPVLFTVADEGFSFPLKKLDVSKIEIPKAFLSLGHVKFDNSGELAAVLSLLTPENSNLLSVWFTPLYFNIHEGTFKLERVDMLISNQFPIASWGKIDLIKDKVKMTIGMSGRALTHAFKIKGLEDDYMLKIPLIGKTSKANIDKPTATAKIGALIAQSHGGPKGLVLGTVLTLAGGALSEKRTPPSTTDPLPWANQMKEIAKEEAENSNMSEGLALEEITNQKKIHKKKAKVNKMLEDQAGNLFKKFLK